MARDGLVSAALYGDARMDAARLVLANLADAVRHGVVARNYTCAESWRRRNGLWQVEARDTLTGERFHIGARKLVDATGPWQRGLRLVRGSHLVYPRLTASENAIAHFEESGRIVFVIPWDGEFSLVGTTDVDHHAGPDEVHISAEEREYLARQVRRLFPAAAAVHPISAFSALRPLAAPEGGSAASATREHRIWNDAHGILRIAGGKFTTYRLMSEQAADLVCREVAPALEAVHLTARRRLDEIPRGAGSPVAFAVEHEMARRLDDVLLISTHIGYEHPETIPVYAAEMAALLGWNEPEKIAEMERVAKIVN